MANAKRVDAADDLLEELVHQFSDPFAFYRELVQNSIDAGSTRIDIVLRYLPDTDGGTTTAEISDWGEGMNRQVIEDYLLTKFRSSKENDLTKIGKFGIGFVSIFAPQPQLVVVDTGRDGEAWRILFKEDRSYELFKCPDPVEGTRVTLHKRMSADEYDTFRRKSLEALRGWCRHSEAEVTFAAGKSDGTAPPEEPIAIGEPFTVNAPFQVTYEEEGTRIVAGVAREEPPPSGLYNRGLTLLETREPLIPNVTFKLLSRYLEHTLTRDNVLRDHHFDRALGLVRTIAGGMLLERVPAELKVAAENGQWDDYSVLLRFAVSRKLDVDRLAFPTIEGGSIQGHALRAVARKLRALPCAAKSTRLTALLAKHGIPALRADAKSALAEQVREVFAVGTRFDTEVLYSAVEAAEPDARSEALVAALEGLLEAAGARSTRAVVGTIIGTSSVNPWMTAEGVGKPRPSDEARLSPFSRGCGEWLCLNRGHARIEQALEIAAVAPALAATLVLRMVAAQDKPLGESEDTELTLAALRS